ncbi:type IV pilin [Salinirussus salinus]|uniref:type IV pilin n=1 Tax=Salinirussus salinus TaxID=1198300 RepID=UPI00135A4F16|nr:type IV pilin N-terminal domain-containing protein [Salinirussus salinus]
MELIQTLRATISGDDDRGVSPVIGVILMVAITVILAAVIATFVLGLGPGGAAPTVNFDSDFESGSIGGSSTGALTVSVTGGDSVPYDQLSFSGDVDGVVDDAGTYQQGDTQWVAGNATGSADGESAISAGDEMTVGVSTTPYEVNVVWESEDGGTTQTLTTFEGE